MMLKTVKKLKVVLVWIVIKVAEQVSGDSNILGFFKQCNSEILVSRGFQNLQGSEGSALMVLRYKP
jgi:hypothetical protein